MLLPEGIEGLGVKTTTNLEEALDGADAINVLRMQFERDDQNAFPSKLEYFKQYGITEERLKSCKKGIVVMHPGPINRGVEMSSGVADGANSVILEQVTNGIAVRMAVLYLVSNTKVAAK
jgi:aspartate carbamoyltransferase catalytic subunit